MMDEMDQKPNAQIEPRPYLASLMNRYTDAYRQAHFIDRLGSLVKVLGWGAGFATFMMGLAVFSVLFSSVFDGSSVVGGLGTLSFAAVFAAFAWFCFYVASTLISTGGQFTLASLDEAVNSSTLIDNPRRLAIIGL
jgi:ABC-type transport system involved in multi-copper enzyme maturation permease subunit